MLDEILPHLKPLSTQINGILSYYKRMLDDDFLFGAAMQIPQAATIFDRVGDEPLVFNDEHLSLPEMLTLIAYRYGFEQVQRVGHGGYAVVIGHNDEQAPGVEQARRVLRLVPDHHVRDILTRTEELHEFDVHLDENLVPVRNPDYPLLLSDVFLLPRHTTKLVFYNPDGTVAEAGGHPAILHCQLLPTAVSFNSAMLDQRMARDAGNMLEAALATLGVSVADAHGGNGGVLVRPDGYPIIYRDLMPDQEVRQHYIPVVLDYGYYSEISARALASVLIRHGVTYDILWHHLAEFAPYYILPDFELSVEALAEVIKVSRLPRSMWGRVLYHVEFDYVNPYVWIDNVGHWETWIEKTYPSLQAQARLKEIYPMYDEALFPQYVEEHRFTLSG